MIFPVNLLTGAKHPTAFSTNQLADINKTKRSYNKVHKKLNNYAQTTKHMAKPGLDRRWKHALM